MGRFVSSSLVAVCFLFFSPALRADGVRNFIERADSFSDSSINFADDDRGSVGGDSAFFESRTFGSDEDHLKRLDDSEDHHGKAWGWYKHHHHHGGDSGWDFGDQDNQDTDGDSGNLGSTSSGDPSTPGVPEPSVLVLLSAGLAAFLLKPLRRATV